MVSCDFVEGDSVAEAVECFDGPVALAVALAVGFGSSGEVVAAEVVVVVVVGVVGEQMPADDQDRVGDGDGGFLLADAAGESPELRAQVAPTATSGSATSSPNAPGPPPAPATPSYTAES